MSFVAKELLSSISSWAEIAAVLFTTLGALSGVTYVLASRPLRKAEARERLVLQARVAEAQSTAAAAEAHIGDAKKEAALAEQHAAEANRTAERERLARVRLEQQLAPRRLTAVQRAKLVDSLGGFTGGATIVSPILDPEATDFGDDLDVALRAAGWETLRVRNFLTVKTGVSVGSFTGSRPLPGIKRLHEALSAAGIENDEVVIGTDEENTTSPHFQAGYIYLLVKRKPQPHIAHEPTAK
jgi:hypothetical protein